MWDVLNVLSVRYNIAGVKSADGTALMRTKAASVANNEITAARARAAARMQRSRDRRAKRMRCYTLELRDEEIAALVRRGLLAPEEHANRGAIIKAMYAFLDRTLGRPT